MDLPSLHFGQFKIAESGRYAEVPSFQGRNDFLAEITPQVFDFKTGNFISTLRIGESRIPKGSQLRSIRVGGRVYRYESSSSGIPRTPMDFKKWLMVLPGSDQEISVSLEYDVLEILTKSTTNKDVFDTVRFVLAEARKAKEHSRNSARLFAALRKFAALGHLTAAQVQMAAILALKKANLQTLSALLKSHADTILFSEFKWQHLRTVKIMLRQNSDSPFCWFGGCCQVHSP